MAGNQVYCLSAEMEIVVVGVCFVVIDTIDFVVFSNGVVMVASLVILLLSCSGEQAVKSNPVEDVQVVLPKGDDERPDIIFISIDSLRADHLSSYGYFRETSPFMDELATQGVRFNWARSNSPWTLPSHMTMFSGLFSTTHQVVDDTVRLDKSIPVLPEEIQSAGWKTA